MDQARVVEISFKSKSEDKRKVGRSGRRLKNAENDLRELKVKRWKLI
jgi:hypothetical protein